MDTIPALPTTPAAPEARQRFDWSRYAAIGFAACYLVATIWSGSTSVDVYSFDLDEVERHYAGPGSTEVASWSSFVLLPIAAAFLTWTLARIRCSLDFTTRGASMTGTAAVVGGVVLAVAMVTSGLLGYAGEAVAAGNYGPADPQTGIGLMLAGGALFVAEGLGAAILAWAVALGARRTRQLPGWLAWVGIVLAPLLLYSWLLFVIPTLVFLIWLVVVSMMLKTDPVRTA